MDSYVFTILLVTSSKLFIQVPGYCSGIQAAPVLEENMSRLLERRDTSEVQCSLPKPLKHGKFLPNPRRCPISDDSPACLLMPRSLVPNHWVLYYSCDPDFHLTAGARASLCTEGRWVPSLPACVPDLNLVSREGWGAQTLPADSEFPSQPQPLKRVVVAHTATQTCTSRADCILTTQSIQQHHIELYGDIGYNFLVGGDGLVLEGQGWNHVGAHTYGYNTGSVGVALIGNFIKTNATTAMLTATQKLIEHGVTSGKLASDYKLNAHCQLIQVASPGRKVFEELKLWPNWDSVNALRCLQKHQNLSLK